MSRQPCAIVSAYAVAQAARRRRMACFLRGARRLGLAPAARRAYHASLRKYVEAMLS